MVPNKFEKHIKEELEQREIQPSATAWKKLSKQLEASSQPKRKSYFWYGVAASFIGLLIVSIIYLNISNEATTPSIQVVENPEKIEENSKGINEVVVEKDSNQVAEADKIVEEKEEERGVNTSNQIPNTKIDLVQVEQVESVPEELDLPIEKSEEIINTKILEVVAQVDLLEQQNEALTEAEVDSLLRRAQQEILNDKLFRKDRSVDAMALLTEVEDELDKSFRDQIFESLKSGFIKVRTAVADRNN